jgi:hypothetical protein
MAVNRWRSSPDAFLPERDNRDGTRKRSRPAAEGPHVEGSVSDAATLVEVELVLNVAGSLLRGRDHHDLGPVLTTILYLIVTRAAHRQSPGQS